MLYQFIFLCILSLSLIPLGFSYLMGFIDEKISDLSLMLYILTYLNLYFLILSYQIKKRLYKLDLQLQEIMSEDEFVINLNYIYVILFGTFTTLLLLSLINYNIDFNNTTNISFYIYGFIISCVIICDNTYRTCVMIKEKIY